MQQQQSSQLDLQKQAIRAEARAYRRAQPDKDLVSQQIMERVVQLPEYVAATVVLFYVDTRDEVRTRPVLAEALTSHRRVVVPYCDNLQLGLFQLKHLDELQVGRFSLLEPELEMRSLEERAVSAEQVDLVLVPGVAFDDQGGRLGQGKGFYDRLLPQLRSQATSVGLAFQCQMFPWIPRGRHDHLMDIVVTEAQNYRIKPAKGQS